MQNSASKTQKIKIPLVNCVPSLGGGGGGGAGLIITQRFEMYSAEQKTA